ncbi:MAG: DNA-deoxyinosine glycosylase [Lachnospiraceae bacterium]|nr:DNA-deoxyinosine glycosylase [Lachnospiraceae bacterium]
MIVHPIPPCFDKESRILILGSFPSVKSRESGFFYGHPQNRFWKVLAAVFEEEVPTSIPEKKAFLSRFHVALWDVLHSCEIKGSADSSIKNAVPNDLSVILEAAPIEKIFVNGKTAEKIYIRFLEPAVGRKAVLLPSTSPANAAWRLEDLVKKWRAAIMER